MKRINLCWSLFLILLCFISAPVVFAATDTGDSIKSDPSVVNGGVDLSTPLERPLLEIDSETNTLRAKPQQVILNIPFQTQINDYYCGPASASMIVRSLGYNKSQQQMAALLGTTTNGTNAGNGVANALNAVVAGSRYRFNWEWHTYTQINKMKNHITEALSWGNPVMVNTMESPGDVYLQGHNIGTALCHFGVIGDYFDNGNSVTYVDPGYGRYGGFVMNQRVTIRNMSYATGGRGYAW